jgi:hypothetical protein
MFHQLHRRLTEGTKNVPTAAMFLILYRAEELHKE